MIKILTPVQYFTAYNSVTKLLFVRGKGFTAHVNGTPLDAQQLALVRATFRNVESTLITDDVHKGIVPL